MTYAYNNAGERDTVHYQTKKQLTSTTYATEDQWWKYEDYVPVGTRSSPGRVFQTMVKLNSAGTARTNEEFHYAYNSKSYTVADQRTCTPWGGIRTGSTTGDPKGRYVASIGHKQDDESGLIYMRTRSYEPTRGRFINEDPAKDGSSWYQYCQSDPANYVDRTGHFFENLLWNGLFNWSQGLSKSSIGRFFGASSLAWLAMFIGSESVRPRSVAVWFAMSSEYGSACSNPAIGGLAQNVVGFYQAYSGFLECLIYIIVNFD